MEEGRNGQSGPVCDPGFPCVADVLRALLVPCSAADLIRAVRPQDPAALLHLLDGLVAAGFARTIPTGAGSAPLVQALAEGLARHASPVFPVFDGAGLIIGMARVTSAVGYASVDAVSSAAPARLVPIGMPA